MVTFKDEKLIEIYTKNPVEEDNGFEKYDFGKYICYKKVVDIEELSEFSAEEYGNNLETDKGKRIDMYALINDNLYWYQRYRGRSIVLARKGQPVDVTYEEIDGVFRKDVNISDTDIRDVYNIHFYVEYRDNIIDNNDIWQVGDGFQTFTPYKIEDGEACIGIFGAVSGNGWETNGRDFSHKIIKLSACTGFWAEYDFKKKDNIICTEPILYKIELSREELIKLIVQHRI